MGDGEGSDDEEEAQLRALLMQQGGKGGISRGPGSAPLTLDDAESKLGTKNTESVKNDDLSRAQPGEVIGLKNGDHEVDRTALPAQAAGTGSAAHASAGL